MRWGIGIVLAILPCVAGDPSVESQVDAVLTEFRAQVAAMKAALPSAGARAQETAYEKLRADAAAKVEAIARRHAPGGVEAMLDIRPACEALLTEPLVPAGRAAWSLALRLLELDPKSGASWSYLELLADHVRREAGTETPPWRDLLDWARAARLRSTIEGEAALALDVLDARLTYELGDKKTASRKAQAVLDDGRGDEELREAAGEVLSLASLLPLGTRAPGFRIAALDGKREFTLADWRGRCVLLHFQALENDDVRLLRAVEDIFYDARHSEVRLLTIPLGTDPDAIALLRENAEAVEWPTAAPGDTANEVGRAYGVFNMSALYLIGPGGRVLANRDWGQGRPADRIEEIVRATVGAPLGERLRRVGASPAWAVFRRFWHELVERDRVAFDADVWKEADACGRRAVDALLLAAGHGDGPRPAVAAKPEGLHSRIAEAWFALRRGDEGPWAEVAKGLRNARSDACLETVDALFDLGLDDPELRPVLEKVAQRAGRWETASMALRCLVFQDTDARPKALRRGARDRVWQVRLAAAEALRSYRHKDSVDQLIDLLGDKRLRVRAAAAESLERLTGELLGLSQKRWAEWRRAQGADLRLPPREINRYTPWKKDHHKYAHRGYYGLQIASSDVTFVLDKSDSMYYGLFDGVVEEMQAHLSSAGPTTRFAVIEFDAEPRAWRKELVPANAANLQEAVAWLHRKKPYGPTNIIDALRLAMENEALDSVVLLSDGLPNRGEPATTQGILAAVQRENRYRRIAIHTVLLLEGRVFEHDGPRGKDIPPLDDAEKERRREFREHAARTPLGGFLEELALSNDGTFGVGFADSWKPPPDATFRDNTDE